MAFLTIAVYCVIADHFFTVINLCVAKLLFTLNILCNIMLFFAQFFCDFVTRIPLILNVAFYVKFI